MVSNPIPSTTSRLTHQFSAFSYVSNEETYTQGVRGGCRASQEEVGGLAGALPFDIVYRYEMMVESGLEIIDTWTLKIILILILESSTFPLSFIIIPIFIHHERNESSKTVKEFRDGCGESVTTISGNTQLYSDYTPDVRYAVSGEI
jgi:hypothetical protein